MKHLAIALLALAAAVPAMGGVIFEDHFDADSLSDYTIACYLEGSAAAWQVSDGVLHGQSLAGSVCYAGVGDPTWEISTVHMRMRTVQGIDKGINIVNTAANSGVAVNLRPAPYNDIMVSYNLPGSFDTLSLPHTVGQWMDVEVSIIGTDVSVTVNGVHLTTRPIYNPASVLPLNAVRPWTYTGGGGPSLNEYDDIVVVGNGVVPAEETSWGALKATYR